MTEADIEAKLALIREEIKTLSPAEREAILASPEPEALSAIEPETIPFSELLLLSLEQRFGRLCTSLETTAKAATAGANNIEALTAQVTRLADALDAVSNTLGCITESVKGEDGEYRCFVCQSAFKFDPVSASNFDPFERRVLAVVLASSELAGVAETWRARVA